jgi:pimeloyl-ACP methyl ester carboxylesterase
MRRVARADVNGVELYYEEHGAGGTPLILLHGGIAGGEIFAGIWPALAERRRVIIPDLQGHGHTADIDRPLRAEHLADDVAALIEALALGRADVLGYSLGGAVTWRLAIQHPDTVRRIVVVSASCRRDGSFPEVVAAFDAFSADMAPMIRPSPAGRHYAEVAPRPDDWPVLIDRTADMLKADFDWTEEVAQIEAPTMLVFADSDSVMPDHVAELFRLRGGGLRDAGYDGAHQPVARLAVLPGRTHYDILEAPGLVGAVLPFLDAPRG